MISHLPPMDLKTIILANARLKTLKKIYSLLEDIKRNGALNGIGKPEKLKTDLSIQEE